MTTSYLLLFFLLLLPFSVQSCPPYKLSCGTYNLDIEFPFFTNDTDLACQGHHLIQCIDLTPVVQFNQQGFIYPVWNISYSEKTVTVHDIRLSAYFRGPDCVFLYEFTSPIAQFDASNLSNLVNSSQPFFSCNQNGYDFSRDVFHELYDYSPCNNYSIYFSHSSENQSFEGVPSYCSAANNLWFDWKFLLGEKGEISLLSAGYSRRWTPFPECFSCRMIAGNCRSSSGGAGSPTCPCNSQCQGMIKSSDGGNKKVIIGVVAGISGFFLACGVCFLFYKAKSKRRTVPPSTLLVQTAPSNSSKSSKSSSKTKFESRNFHLQTPFFSYEELEEATNGFDASKEIGEGGYGTVYKGVLWDGRIVAVKRLYETSYKRVEQFVNEVEILSRLRHPNLVTLYGSTSPASPHLLLVYEFISNGTLADHIHDPLRSQSISLPLRLSLAIETATALSYLHSVDPPIIHRDVKSHNILVDEHFHVKVADFGLSRLFPTNATHISTAPQGTPGYLDPEYHQYYQLTDKSDVYSFGVVLMELISSRPAVDVSRPSNEISLAMLAVKKIQKGEIDHLVDPVFGYHSNEEVQGVITRIAELAFRCLQSDREMRPPIKEVLEELKDIGRGVAYIARDGEIKVKEEARLLKNSAPFSPNSVTDAWPSRSTTPSTSK